MIAPRFSLSGQRFGKLAVADRSGTTKSGTVLWLCRCDCGKTKTVRADLLRSGQTKSCGCLRRRSMNRTHGRSKTTIYKLWQNMIRRCHDGKCESYRNYGARGITVCDRWKVFENFLADMGEKPAGKSLDRLDNDKGYSPENCEWKSPSEQGRNTRVNRRVTIDGITKPIIEWCEHYGIPYGRVYHRIRKGWDLKTAFTETRDMRKVTREYLECPNA